MQILKNYVKQDRYVKFVFDDEVADGEVSLDANMFLQPKDMSGMATGPVGEPAYGFKFSNLPNQTKLTLNYEASVDCNDGKFYNGFKFENKTVDIKFGENDCTNVEYLHHSIHKCVFITFFTPKSNDRDNTRLFSKYKIQILCFTERNIVRADWVWEWLEHCYKGNPYGCVKLNKFANVKMFKQTLNYSGFRGCLVDFFFLMYPELVDYHRQGKRKFDDKSLDKKYDLIKDVHNIITNRVYKSFMKKYTKNGKYTCAERLANNSGRSGYM